MREPGIMAPNAARDDRRATLRALLASAVKLLKAVLAELVQTASDSNWVLQHAKADATLEEIAEFSHRNELFAHVVFFRYHSRRSQLLIVWEAGDGKGHEFVGRVAILAKDLGFVSRSLSLDHLLNVDSNLDFFFFYFRCCHEFSFVLFLLIKIAMFI